MSTLEQAAAAGRDWATTPLATRAAACEAMVASLVERADELGRELTEQMGRPIAHSPNEIRRGFRERADHMIAIAPGALADLNEGTGRFIRRQPLGVVLVLAPWNYPWLSSVNAIVPALVAGNAVVLKSSSQTPLVSDRYREAAVTAGLPLFTIDTDHDGVAELIGDERVGFVAFTGSVSGGHAVQRAMAKRFIAANLELGGKDPAYVRPDADVRETVAELADGAFFNAGQSCCAVERIYAHHEVYDDVVEGLVEAARALRLGDPLDPDTTIGPMVRTSAADFVRGQIDDAVAKGARALVQSEAGRPGTPYLAPEVLVDVDHGMTVMSEETFGPVVGVMAVADDDEAIGLMNDSRYGLTASVWSADVDAAIAIGDRLETGTVYLNRCDFLDPALAWTGVKDSGRGVSLSRLAYEALTRPKSFHLRTAW
jgi:acyl-CoA reductase-like NAD-dependent aldehyde dehydrogenase